jgi:uncharacterized membrane protein YdbT with pleckstrin-like domain
LPWGTWRAFSGETSTSFSRPDGTVIAATLASVIIIAVAVVFSGPSFTNGLSLLLLILLIIPVGRLITTYLDWWNDQFIVSTRRIIQIRGIFNKHVIDSSLEKVNDVVMDQSVLGRLLGYGDIEILTASDIGVNKLLKIANPIRFKTTMLDQKHGLSDSGAEQTGHTGPRTVPEMIQDLAKLRDDGVLSEEEFQAKKNQLMSRM